MRKNLLIFLLILFLSVNLFSVEYWIRVPSPTTRWLTKCYLVDTVYGWAAGDSGTIINTSNSGVNWTLQNSGISNLPIDDIFFLNRRLGWALANDYLFTGTIVLKTTNGGLSWTNSRFSDTSIVLNTVYYLDSLTGYMSGFSGKIVKTTNSGSSWVECRIDTLYCPYLYLFPKLKFSFLNSQTGFACGGHMDIQGIIWKTSDAGMNWFTYCVSPEPQHDIKVINSSKIIATGGDYEYGAITVQSYNSGNAWLYDTTGLFGVGQCLAFRTPSELWIPLSFSQTWALNLDSGSISSPWYNIPATDSTSVYAAQFASPTYGWAFGSWGAIMKYNTLVIGITGNQYHIPDQSVLYQNFPNPFNPSTTIFYKIKKKSFVKISIYNVVGELVEVLLNSFQEHGNHKIVWNAAGIASGLYFCKLETDNFEVTKKMVLIK